MVSSVFLTEGFLQSCPQVSSTTHQLMEEMDHALKGVWPYDKKEDEDSYHRKNSRTDDDPHDIIQVLDSQPQQQQASSSSKRKSQVRCSCSSYLIPFTCIWRRNLSTVHACDQSNDRSTHCRHNGPNLIWVCGVTGWIWIIIDGFTCSIQYGPSWTQNHCLFFGNLMPILADNGA